MTHPRSMDALLMNRRRWLQLGGASLAGAFGAGSLSALLRNPVHAQATDPYRALVCVFLYGGNDGMNMVVPTDNTRYGEYAAVRKTLALPQGSLIPITGTGFGLHPSMSALASVCSAEKIVPVMNVGPLYGPLTKAQFRSLPDTDPLIPTTCFPTPTSRSSGSRRARPRWCAPAGAGGRWTPCAP